MMREMLLTAVAAVWSLPAFCVATELSEIVTIANRAETGRLEVAASTAVLDRENLELLSHAHIQQAVSRLAGVNLNRGNGQEYLPAMRSPVLTGAGACGGLLMAEDGIPLRSAGFCNINELFEAHSEVAQRIEVLRGPGTVLYGSNALHGVINIITPEVAAPDTLDFEFAADDYYRFKLTAATENAVVATSLTHDGGYRDQSGFDQQKLSFRHAFNRDQWSVITGFTATNLNQETAGYITGLNAYKDSSKVRLNANPQAYRDAHSARLWSRIGYQLSTGELIVTPYLRHTEMDFLQHFLPGGPVEQNGQTGAGFQFAYYVSPEDNLNLIIGAEGEYTHAYLKQSQDRPTQGSQFLRETIPVGRHYDYQVDAAVAALFANLQWSVAEHWTAQGGLRYEATHYDYHNLMLAGRTREDGSSCSFGGCRYSRPESGTNGFDNWSADTGLIYKIDASHSAYLRLSRAFRAPQATELYRLQRDQQITDLQPESISAVELGIKGKSAALRYGVALYQMEKDHHIYRDSDFFQVSDGNTEHQGIELELAVKVSSRIEFNLSATQAHHRYLHSRLIKDINIRGNDMDTAPRHFGNARILWRRSDKARIELEWQSMGDYFLDAQNLHSYSGHNIFNLRVAYQPTAALKLYWRLLNITDRVYAERADYTGFSGERYFPGLPRTVKMGIRWLW